MSQKNMDLQQRQQFYIDCIERLNGGAIARLSWENLYLLLDDLTEKLPLILHPLKKTDKFIRGRILSDIEPFPTIKTLSYPPVEKCHAFGRCNKPHEPVLYSGVGSELIFSEIGAKIGDIVGLLYICPVRDLFIARLGALELWRRTNGMCLMNGDIKAEIKKIYLNPENIIAFLLDAFISDHFSRPSSPDTYKLTSAYTSCILDSNKDIAGLIYDSVDHTKGACLAIKPIVFDEYLQPTEVQIVRITNYLGYGVYDFEEIHFSNKFEDDTISWDR